MRKTIFSLLSIFLLVLSLGCVKTPSLVNTPQSKTYKPQEVVEKFLGAINSGNYEEAWNLQSDNLKKQSSFEEFQNSLEQYKKYFGVSKQTWEIKEVSEEGGVARVRLILITYFQNGTSAVRESQYLLKLEGGSWKIDGLLETP